MSLGFPLAWWMIALLVLGALTAAYGAYASAATPLTGGRRTVLGALRAAALLLLLAFLLRPVAITSGPMPDTVVSVVLDNSQSMRIADDADRRVRRLDRAVSAVRDSLLPRLTEQFTVAVFDLEGRMTLDDLSSVEPGEPRSDLAAALRRAAESEGGRTVAGIVLLSDGGDTGEADPAEAVEGLPPVFTLDVTGPPASDLEVASLRAGQTEVAGSVVELTAAVVRRGGGARPVTVQLREGGRTLEVRRLTPAGDGALAYVTFQVPQPERAAALYTVEARVEPDEIVVENNRRSVLVVPPGRARRVLMLEGAPGFEHGFLKRVWLADPGVEFDAVVRKGRDASGATTFYIQGDRARTGALGSGFPHTRADLFAYDAVVLANIGPDAFRPVQLDLIREFVEQRGGGLLLIGAASLPVDRLRGSPLEPLLPVVLSGRVGDGAIGDDRPHRLLLTDDGAVHPVTRLGPSPEDTRRAWESTPALAGSTRVGTAKPAARVLARVGRPEGGSSPLVVVQRVARGRSMVFAGEAAWRWKMMMPSETRIYERFWGQAIRWLSAEAPDPITVEASSDAAGGRLSFDVWTRDGEFRPVADARVTAVVTAPSGETTDYELALTDPASGRYTASVDAARRGVYRIDVEAFREQRSLGAGTEWTLLGEGDPEFAGPWSNDGVLRRVAEASQGAVLDTEGVSELSNTILARTGRPVPTTRDLWHEPWTFVLVLGVLTTEWVLRRRWGMR